MPCFERELQVIAERLKLPRRVNGSVPLRSSNTTIKSASALFFLLAAVPAAAQGGGNGGNRAYEIGRSFSIVSEVLGEERSYWVHLPASYDDPTYMPQRYPVVYLLDGNEHFHAVTGVVEFMSAGVNGNRQIPEMIVVAISNTIRTRDLTPPITNADAAAAVPEGFETGGGDGFLQFLTDELAVAIDSEFRTLPYRALVGHSLGGLLSLHALLSVPGAFHSYIAIDPSLWWDNQALVHRAERRFADADELVGAVFLATATNSTIPPGAPNPMLAAAESFAISMDGATSPDFRAAYRHFEAEDHGSVLLAGLYQGLLHLFAGYKLSFADLIGDPSTALVSHFERASERIGLDLPPPEAFVDQLGSLMGGSRIDEAIELFLLNVASFPESPNAYLSLAKAYALAGRVPLAIESLEKAIELDPSNEEIRSRLRRLRAGD